MRKNDTSIRNGIEDFLCPFTDMFITQGSNMKPSHMGIMANDVRGLQKGLRYPYYAPCTCKCLNVWKENGQVMWQSVNKVRFANGRIDFATFMTAHDDSCNAKIGQIVKQGQQLGNMGNKAGGGAYSTGVHCHIEVSQSKTTSWTKNKYGIYHFPNEYDLDDCYYVNNTNILNGMGGNWKTIDYTPKEEFVNLPDNIDFWSYYDVSAVPIKKNAKGTLCPKKYGGLSYKIYGYLNNNTCVKIKSKYFGFIKIYINNTPATITNSPTYNLVD